ncbi:uncharacterized protein LOC134069677 [Sardina pilchardus]|uniref:uncharacterized protein LOC134069677 n=1 Tax=Sardina pilchardus TaxID=27697 RepID=UPI002E0EB666
MKRLLFLAAVTVCWFLVKAKPTIKMIPKYGLVYWGDTVTLKCSETPSEWLVNGTTHKLSNKNQILILPAVSSKDSGDYRCKTGEESDSLSIEVKDYLPPAFLTIVSEYAVVNKDESPLFQLFSDEGLTNWYCRILRDDRETYVRMEEKDKAGKTMQFYAEVRGATPEIIWCKRNGTKGVDTKRSNSISLRSSDTEVLLEIPPEPAVLGDPLTLRCEVRGGAKINAAEFYKDNVTLGSGVDGSYEISVTDGSVGSYTCTATFSYTYVNPHGALKKNVPSAPQTLTLIRESPPSADISKEESALVCTCPGCSDHPTFRWYHREPNAMYLKMREEKTSELTYDQPGEYACRAVWDKGASRRSKFENVGVVSGGSGSPAIYLVVVLIIAGLLFVGIALLCRNKRRGQSGLQGDVPMTRRKKAGEEGDDEKDPAYEALKGSDKDEYHTVRVDGADGGYEAVGAARAAKAGDGGDGGYEALKGKAQAEVYHTLGGPQSQGADGGYEALKLKGQGDGDGDVYHTLQQPQAQGAEGGYEALKGAKQSEYETLKSKAGDGGGGGGGEPE